MGLCVSASSQSHKCESVYVQMCVCVCFQSQRVYSMRSETCASLRRPVKPLNPCEKKVYLIMLLIYLKGPKMNKSIFQN